MPPAHYGASIRPLVLTAGVAEQGAAAAVAAVRELAVCLMQLEDAVRRQVHALKSGWDPTSVGRGAPDFCCPCFYTSFICFFTSELLSDRFRTYANSQQSTQLSAAQGPRAISFSDAANLQP